MAQFVVASPFILPPGAPEQTVQSLQKAFAETMADPALLSEARVEHLDISFTPAERVKAILTQLYRTPMEITGSVQKALAAN
jgi:hypothetical protein